MPSLITKSKAMTEEFLDAATLPDAPHVTANMLGQIADAWWEVKQKRLEADKVAENLKARESKMQAALIAQCIAQEITGAAGNVVRVGVEKTDEPKVEDWQKYYAHILETKEFDLLERRPGRGAIKARWEDGKTVPGVSKFPVYKLTKQGVK